MATFLVVLVGTSTLALVAGVVVRGEVGRIIDHLLNGDESVTSNARCNARSNARYGERP